MKGLIALLEEMTADLHDASEHRYEEEAGEPGICKHCGWLNPEAAKLPCGHTMRDHALEWLADLHLVQMLDDGEVEVVVIEITVGLVEEPRSRRQRWPLN